MRLTPSLYSVRTMTSRKQKGSYLARGRTSDQGSFPDVYRFICGKGIAPMQKWLPLNYSLVPIQNSFTNLVRDSEYDFCLRNEFCEPILNTNKRII